MPNHQSPPKQAPYGFWESPISVDAVLANAIQPMYPQGTLGWLFWLEARPAQKGRQVIVAQMPCGTKRELLPEDYSARSQFLEYGGCPFWLAGKELIWVNAQDQNLYATDFARPAGPRKLTQSGGRYADIQWDAPHNRLLAVMETPTQGLSSLSIVGIDLSLEEQNPRVLHQGADFYAYLNLAPNGQQLAFIQWHQGHMPWDATALMVAEVQPDGSLATPATWVAEDEQQAIAQPQFGPDGSLYWVSDATNWWNLYRRQDEKVAALAPMAAECTTPRWVSGMSSYCCVGADEILCCYTQGGLWNLARLNTQEGQWQVLLTDYPHVSQLSSADGGALFLAAEPQGPIQIYRYSEGQVKPLAAPAPDELQAYYSQPKSIYVPSDGYNLHAFFYPPHNPDYSEPEGLPPVIVLCHGGPTGQTSALLNLKNQYWTSRGFAVLDVNYRGSTGFGRAFRHSLHGAWGQADVEDLCNAAALCNVRKVVKELQKEASPALLDPQAAGRLLVVGAYYHLDSGRVEFLDQ